jgi:predicted dehydrogenase
VAEPLHVAFLGCGFITRVHSRVLRSMREEIVCSYASRDESKAARFREKFSGRSSYGATRPRSATRRSTPSSSPCRRSFIAI